MRIGNNPLKSAALPSPARVVVAVITHLPDMESDYHKTRFDVIRKSILSLDAYAYEEHELIIWDNGSCDYLREWLYGHDDAATIILSRNIGKTNALKSIMRMLPPDTILAYGDDDIEYFPNWLAPQIKILETYPKVGTVTGWPVRLMSTWGEIGTLTWANQHAQVETGKFIPSEWDRDYCESIGRDYEGYKTQVWGVQDSRITYKGVQAYATSQHCQFVCYPKRIEPLIPWTDRAMQDEIAFDRAVDYKGLLRLATVERLTRHMGNVLEERVQNGELHS
jgi:glycosyltransferase involved in cell wall biosynthesis